MIDPNKLTKEDIGLRPVTEAEKFTTAVKDWRGVTTNEKGPKHRRTCDQTIDGGRVAYRCGKDATWAGPSRRHKDKTDFYCSNHAAGKLRAAKNDAKKAAVRKERDRGIGQAMTRLNEAAEALGIEAELDYRWTSRAYSETHAVVSIDDLEQLAETHSDCVPLEQA